ncbi:uncharacterized protein F4822DRAFT_133346 [Hypoxylon trugodes]|uniref:uncharacterized protein n=1 Tax=Hypoxylon trugodes TaxID=326681 RepID=UPI00218E33B6|nr:uncharacterized protein F4822DRAFT_133346 [Hypoxylon trugodes]KAI1392590.1 hypothetical protein F4822DRAFT_133346 [Hypoxylon trugodes]
MPPQYPGFTIVDAIKAAGPAPDLGAYGFDPEHTIEPPVNFYCDVQPCRAVFSTHHGTKPFQTPENPQHTGARRFRKWNAGEIQACCDNIRSSFPVDVMHITPLENYAGLYEYFDAHDLYHLGTHNLWNVIHHLHFENQYYILNEAWMSSQVERIIATNEVVREKLRNFDPRVTNDILSMFKPEELGDLARVSVEQQGALRAIFVTQYMRLSRGGSVRRE